MSFENLARLAEEEIQRVKAGLPAEVAERVNDTPIFLERIPNATDLAEGIELDTLGLFEPGPGAAPLPQIRLWLENIWDYAEGDPVAFLEEVRITLLHEIGHLIGWEEEDLEDRGLD